MPKYLIKLQPLEAYFFGGERTFGFGKVNGQIQKYYIISEKTPSQTTLFGTLRYIILAQNHALFGEENASKTEQLVGKESFSFEKALSENAMSDQQNFGMISSISPLFLIKEEEWLIPTPYNHNPGDKNSPNKVYTPFSMDFLSVTSGDGFTLFPTDYYAKNGYGGGYTALSDLHIVPDKDIFLTDVRAGINSHRTENTSNGIEDDGSFFKKERKMLKDGYCFAFIAELSENIQAETSVVFMGQEKSSFRYEIQETEEDLIKRIQNAFQGRNQTPIQYAFSDIMPVGELSFSRRESMHYYIADTKVLRNLETNLNADNYYARFKKSEKLYKLMKAGSVFFTEEDFCVNAALNKIGLNTMIKL